MGAYPKGNSGQRLWGDIRMAGQNDDRNRILGLNIGFRNTPEGVTFATPEDRLAINHDGIGIFIDQYI